MNVKLEYIDAIDGGIVMKVVSDVDAAGYAADLRADGHSVLNIERLEESTFPSMNS